jgi:hypothetical protein
MKKLIIVAAAAAGLFSSSVQATPISGGLSFAGNYTPNNEDLTVATSLTFGTTFVTSVNGDFSAIVPGTLVVMASPLAINPTVTPVFSLWAVGGFSFDAYALVQSSQTANTLTLTGTGIINDNNPTDAVAGSWLATFNTLSHTFSYSASAGSVPDGGSTMLLLGSALTGLGLLKRKLFA